MLKIETIRKTLDAINVEPMTAATCEALWALEEAWSAYDGKELGGMRQVIDDRLDLAHSRRREAGFTVYEPHH